MFDIKTRDWMGRVGKLKIGDKIVNTPNIAVVINPNKMIVPIEKMKDFEIVITNSYIIKNSDLSEKIEKEGIKKYLGWEKPIYTDSGTFQMYSIGNTKISNEETLEFQKKIGSDIITPLDLFTFPEDDYETAKDKLKETTERLEYANKIKEDKLLSQPIQGGKFLDLRKEACSKIYGDIIAIGGIVPLMEKYDLKRLVDIVMTCKMNLPFDKPVHAFGAGNPQIFSLLSFMGVDIFDSAAYALYAARGAYITIEKIISLDELKEATYLPCSCSVCKGRKPEDLNESLLAEHNLNVTLEEIKKIRFAIRNGRLYEFVQNRARTNAKIYEAFIHLVDNYGDYLQNFVSFKKKKAIHYLGEETERRPDVQLAILRYKKRVGRSAINPSFKENFPFNMVGGEKVFDFGRKEFIDEEKIKKIIDFQYGKGVGKVLFKNIKIEKSKKTGRIRRIIKNKEIYATLRTGDGYFVLSKKAMEDIKKTTTKYRVVVDDEAIPFIKEGKSLFCGFSEKYDFLLPGEQVILVDKKDDFLGTGDTVLGSEELSKTKFGVAVTNRD